MTSELGKSCQSGEAVLALKKYISKCNLDNERLKEEIAANKHRDDFLSRFRCEDLLATLPQYCYNSSQAFRTYVPPEDMPWHVTVCGRCVLLT